MKPLIVLLVSALAAVLLIRLFGGAWEPKPAARIALAAMLLFTSIAHFVFVKGMALMLPDWAPFKKGLVWLTGLLEITGAIGLLLPAYYRLAGVALIAFFMLVLPANVQAAQRHIDHEKGDPGGLITPV